MPKKPTKKAKQDLSFVAKSIAQLMYNHFQNEALRERQGKKSDKPNNKV